MKKKPFSFWIIIILSACCIILLQFIDTRNVYQKSTFENMLVESKYIVEAELPLLIESREMIKNTECTFFANVERSQFGSHFDWIEYCKATIYIDDAFDHWSDKEQYEFINDLASDVAWDIGQIMNEHYPYYHEYLDIYGILRVLYGECVFHNREEDIIFKTSKNTYEHSDYADNYYIKNGNSIYVLDEEGNWDGGNTGLDLWGGPVVSKDGICCYGSCHSTVREGSAYCHIHSCCKDDCPNMKDYFVHCCDEHNCIEPGCGGHRYDYANSQYCNTHFKQHYYD